MVGVTPEVGTRLVLDRITLVASENVGPVTLAKLTEVKLLYGRFHLDAVVHFFERLFLRKVHALELVQKTDVPQVAIL